ncbi:hypothetical protein [Salmonirosea aquatica]|uniref:Holin n=1 Tax=Salmonirosea aquatica TaxID=2654236 RepID=A0A7C9BK07_9BACT|nr:hypothetical protein [Cytophagaceae bacterium SJW1-29]MPR37121.1 hypothetical protein [Cytophagaceae bacterium SJW1-29]MPR37162.1 hypothetical protein [Cytophagaceae bacterium SJW1-29]
MKEFILIAFAHFVLFQIIFGIVLLDAVLGITRALIKREFKYGYLTQYLYKLLAYTAVLIAGNLVEYASQLTGHTMELIGIIPVFVTIATAELGSLKKKFQSVTPAPDEA